MRRRITPDELMSGADAPVELSFHEALFLTEYVKDCAPRRAAEASGYNPDHGSVLLSREHVQTALKHVLCKKLEVSLIDAEWLLYELVDNHEMARQRGQIGASTTALINIGKHKMVDAFVAKEVKVELDSSEELLSRLRRGRARNAADSFI